MIIKDSDWHKYSEWECGKTDPVIPGNSDMPWLMILKNVRGLVCCWAYATQAEAEHSYETTCRANANNPNFLYGACLNRDFIKQLDFPCIQS